MNVKTKQGATIIKYGQTFRADAHPAAIELFCIGKLGKWEFRDRKCGEGLPFHVKEFMKLAWPDMYFHKWTDLIIDTFLKSPGRTALFGPSSSQKSFVVSRCALAMFYGFPNGTTVLISSTTLDALKRRIWDYVSSSHREAKKRLPFLPGSMIESKLMLLADEATEEGRSFKNGVVGVACKVGGIWKGLEAFIGAKNDRMIVVADEMQFVSEGVSDSLANLESNDVCYSCLMGNLPDVHNPLARAAEPKLGWESLPDTEVSRVYETKWKNGRAIQLIGTDSPNLDYPEGQEPFPKLIGRRYIEQCAQNYGKESDKFAMFASGKIPRSSMNRTVFTKAQAIKFSAMESIRWSHHPITKGYGLDVAYSGVGGDRTVGFPFMFGKDIENKFRLWIGPMKVYPGSSSAQKSHAEAIADDLRLECETYGIDPERVFYDGTGRSEFTISVARAWSSKVVPIEFGGPATDRPVFTGEKHLHGDLQGERKTCREAFDRFVSELWFAAGYCIVSDQMRGLPEDAVDEGCQRKWEIVRGAKQSIETKDDMKERGLRSPDIFDAVVCCVEGARRLGFPLGKDSTPAKTKTSRWLQEESESEWERLKKNELQAA